MRLFAKIIFSTATTLATVVSAASLEDAQKALEYAYNQVRASFEHEQNNNEYEVDLQNDLTPELVQERYPMLEPTDFNNSCAYYHKKK